MNFRRAEVSAHAKAMFKSTEKTWTLNLKLGCIPEFTEEFCGLTWDINCLDLRNILVTCERDSLNTLWCCEAFFKVKIISPLKNEHIPSLTETSFLFDYNNRTVCLNGKWEDLIDQEKLSGGGEVVVELTLRIEKVFGVRNAKVYDFLSVEEPFANAVLLINGQQIHVNKEYLSLHSPFFKAMFFSEFEEQKKTEFKLEDVVPEEFIELLRVVYPCCVAVTDKSVEFLLQLGDKFLIDDVKHKCEDFLISSCEITCAKKLQLADKFSLSKLQEVSLRELQCAEDLKNVLAAPEYTTYSLKTTFALLERVLLDFK